MVAVNWEIEQLLRSAEMDLLLQRAVRTSGLELESWELKRVYSRPHGETSARFHAQVSGRPITLVASTRKLGDSDRARIGAVRCESAVGILHIWAHPSDPELPGLHIVEEENRLRQRLSPLLGAELQIEQSQMLVLRPLRRAVYRVVVSSEMGFRTVFLKVVRPRRIAELVARHRACTLAPPAADLGDGILAVDQAPGVSMTDLLYLPNSPNPGVRISPETVLSGLESITESALQLPPKTPAARRFESFIDTVVAGGADPERLRTLSRLIRHQLSTSPGAAEPSHGDFHPANVFLTEDGRRVTALIDADTVGPGHRRDDLAMMLAHLVVLPSFDAMGYRTAPGLAQALWHAYAHSGRHDLAARTAASLLCLAPGARSPDQLRYFIAAAESTVRSGHISVIEHTHDSQL
ncbi:phosphotransferase family protein [Nesterenkonia muleiensis]|uniref:phosphotransferase family protein n=1 Tax=Nesterenkonia muleiensis TaxID=2282648 RepID=UPI000E73B905|nr:phosphotransferase [Nesterenkonia muleiensis]